MAQDFIPARSIVLQVEDAVPDTWVAVAALNGVTPDFSANNVTTEVTTFDSDGEYEARKMQRGASMTLVGLTKKDDTTDAQDPGQARCEELASSLGNASVGRIRFRHPQGTSWRIWDAIFTVGAQGGGNNAMIPWNCTIMRTGAETTAAVV